MRRLYGATGHAVHKCNFAFVSTWAYEHGIQEELGLNKVVLPVHNTRNLTKRNTLLNDYLPTDIRIDPQTFDVYIDDELITCDTVDVVPMAQRYYLF